MTEAANSEKKLLVFLLLVAFVYFAPLSQAQEAVDSIQIYAQMAVDNMDNNQPEAAIVAWERALALAPDNVPFRYEFALANVMAKRYDSAIALLAPIYRNPQLLDRGYQLLGNCYDMLNDSARSLPYYREGLVAFPQSGRLHYEMGAAALIDGNPMDATEWWRKGAQFEPAFATNYYWLARTHAGTRDRIWGVLYAEAFLNLERNTQRTREISKLLFDTWNASMMLGDTTDPINFCTDSLLEILSPNGPNVMSFPVAFEYTIATSAEPLIPSVGVTKRLTVAQMVDVRIRMVKAWSKAGYDTLYPNDVLTWNVRYLKSGWLKEYLWWVYSYGDKKEMNEYFKANEDRYDNFLGWYGQNSPSFKNPLCIDLRCQ
ncbi:MAG: tetratricopeptide repeat protein [bacterium]|nr:tetratricopeptide repeat protein [bacterium]